MLKKKAIALRKQGKSYNEISKKLKIPKGTLSYWFSNFPALQKITQHNIKKAKNTWAKNITIYNKQRSIIARQKWLTDQSIYKKQIKSLSNYNLLLVGTVFYWAEEYKRGNWNVVFSNSDPAAHRLMIQFFVKICGVPKSKIKAQIQIHSTNDYDKTQKYWTEETGLPASQFLRPTSQISRSSKQKIGNRLPYGTLRLKIDDVLIVNKIKGWIQGLADLYR